MDHQSQLYSKAPKGLSAPNWHQKVKTFFQILLASAYWWQSM
jgi:hypothetical protein